MTSLSKEDKSKKPKKPNICKALTTLEQAEVSSTFNHPF